MLDKTRLDYTARTNPVKVVRAVAAMVRIFIKYKWMNTSTDFTYCYRDQILVGKCEKLGEIEISLQSLLFHHSIIHTRHHSIHSFLSIIIMHQQAIPALLFHLMGTLSILITTDYLSHCFVTPLSLSNIYPGHKRKEKEWKETATWRRMKSVRSV